MPKNAPKLPSQRQLRVGEQLRHIIAETLMRGHFQDERLLDAGSKVTVTEVQVTPDLRQATAFVTPLGGGEMGEMLEALQDAAPQLQQEINRQSQLKFTPRLTFRHDDTFEKAQRMDSILSNLHYSDQG